MSSWEEDGGIGRRDWLRTVGISICAVGASGILGQDWTGLARGLERTARDEVFRAVKGLAPEITSNDRSGKEFASET